MAYFPDIFFTGINTQTNNYTLLSNDNLYYIRMNSSTSLNLTIPKQSLVNFDISTEITIEQSGIGSVTLVPDTGVTLLSYSSLVTAGQYAVISIKKVNNDIWLVRGNLL